MVLSIRKANVVGILSTVQQIRACKTARFVVVLCSMHGNFAAAPQNQCEVVGLVQQIKAKQTM